MTGGGHEQSQVFNNRPWFAEFEPLRVVGEKLFRK
jgi:hypothetical protein